MEIYALVLCNLCTYVIVSRSVSDRIAFAVQSGGVRCPIGLRSVHDEKVWNERHQKSYFYSFFPIHLGSTMVPITRNG